MTYPDAALHDTASHEWRDICFARWICRLPDRAARQAFMNKLRHRHGAIIVGDLAELVKAEWARRAQWSVREDSLDLFAAGPASAPADAQRPSFGPSFELAAG